MPHKRPGGIVDTMLGIFSPLAGVAKDLQLSLHLDRTLWCRTEHGRLEIVMRGGGLTDDPLPERIALARKLTDAARPVLAAHRKRQIRRLAGRAIAVVFEDEQIVDDGVATSRFSYLASHDHDDRGVDGGYQHTLRQLLGEKDPPWL